MAPFAALVLVAAILGGLVVAVLFENHAPQPA
jgi:hypothetical protein